ncbi:MAG: ComEC family competence protein [Bacteroidales bacterium]|nr:ComEC family competence protein [Bacteroidales bacterium]
MNSFLGKTPFFRLLLPVLIGIILWHKLPLLNLSMLIPSIIGLVLMLLSFFIIKKEQYNLRWVFGVGLSIFLISLTHFQYHKQEVNSTLEYTDNHIDNYYIGTIIDIPELKPRSVACNVKLAAPTNTKAILYFEQTYEAFQLQPGDMIVFYSKLEPFKNFGNPDDFDYPNFMKTRGFSCTGYVAANDWQNTNNQSNTITCVSQRIRAKALIFYKSFGLTEDAYAFISALTLGYKSDLTENIQEAFRVSGTAHVLALSGLHVGIIYIVISMIFSFLGNRGKPYFLRQCLIILVLWGYVFISGMSASVIRAAIMLTINCIGNICNRKGFTLNTLFAAAFLILIYSPFTLFDISFQMSFGAVFSILFFQPMLQKLYTPTNKINKYLWSLSTVSLSAQLGVFPLVLYYFGTFPTYFFITNILVVPLVAIIIYTVSPLIILNLPIFINSVIFEYIRTAFQWTVKALIEITLQIVYFAEALPSSQISDLNISAFQTILLVGFIFLFTNWLFTKRPRSLIFSLTFVWVFLLVKTYNYTQQKQPELVVFNSRYESEILLFHKNKRHFIEIPENGLLPHREKSIYRLSDCSVLNNSSDESIMLDILILSGNKDFNLEKILAIFNPSIIVLDSKLPSYFSKKLTNQCKLLGIVVHDVTKDGAFSVEI